MCMDPENCNHIVTHLHLMIVIIKIKGLVNSMKNYRRLFISVVILLIGVSFLSFSRGNYIVDPFEEG